MKKVNEDDYPLVKGGQGRSDEEVEDTVKMTAWICVFGLSVLAIGLLIVSL